MYSMQLLTYNIATYVRSNILWLDVLLMYERKYVKLRKWLKLLRTYVPAYIVSTFLHL